jgi:PKD repeat protein
MKNAHFLLAVLALLLSGNLLAQRKAGPPKKIIPQSKESGVLIAYSSAISPSDIEQSINNCGLVTNLKYIGDTSQIGKFDHDQATSGMKHGLIIASGSVSNANGPNLGGSTGNAVGNAFDEDLNSISNGVPLFDTGGFEFDLTATSEYFTCWVVFGSEEYEEYTGSLFNDLFAVFVKEKDSTSTYQNISKIPGTSFPIRINTINQGAPGISGDIANLTPPLGSTAYSSYYVSSLLGSQEIEYDGFTVPLLLQYPMEIGKTYHVKFVIADASDGVFDSGLLITSDLYQVDGIAAPTPSFKQSTCNNIVSVVNESKYADTYIWDFGDGTKSTQKEPPPHTYSVPGNYKITLKASNVNQLSSQKQKSYIPNPVLELVSLGIVHKKCMNPGKIQVEINSEEPNISYKWSDQKDIQTLTTTGCISKIARTDLEPGKYSLMVYAGNKQQSFGPYEIMQSEDEYGLNATVKPSCSNTQTGEINISTNANIPAQIIWSHDPELKELWAKNLAPGVYQLTLIDEVGCATLKEFIVPESSVYMSDLVVSAANCQNQFGSFQFEITGGQDKIDCTVLDAGNKIIGSFLTNGFVSLENLKSGNYKISLVDQNNCTSDFNVEIPLAEGTESDVYTTAQGEDNISSVAIGTKKGVPPFQYSWSDGFVGSFRFNTDFSKTYLITITDALGCTEVLTIGKPKDQKNPLHNFIAFPNPGDQYVELRLDNHEAKILLSHVDLIDMSGRILVSTDFKTGEKFIINTSAITNGLYYLMLSGEGFHQMIKLPVMH